MDFPNITGSWNGFIIYIYIWVVITVSCFVQLIPDKSSPADVASATTLLHSPDRSSAPWHHFTTQFFAVNNSQDLWPNFLCVSRGSNIKLFGTKTDGSRVLILIYVDGFCHPSSQRTLKKWRWRFVNACVADLSPRSLHICHHLSHPLHGCGKAVDAVALSTGHRANETGEAPWQRTTLWQSNIARKIPHWYLVYPWFSH